MLPLALASLENGDDVRMPEIRRRFGFATEPEHVLFASEVTGQNHLHRDDAVEALLQRFIDDAHAAAGDFFQQFVIAKGAEATVLVTGCWKRSLSQRGLSHRFELPQPQFHEALRAMAGGRVGRQFNPATDAGSLSLRVHFAIG